MPTGRIIKGVGGLYFVDVFNKIYQCQARGKFRIDGVTPLVGDIVDISIVDEEKNSGYLQKIHERKNELIRPKAANIDIVVIVFAAAKPSINLDLLDSFLIVTEYNVKNIDIIICVNKVDLVETSSLSAIREIYGKAGYRLIEVSAVENTGIDTLRKELRGKTSIVAGPSGVGKSSILNALSPGITLRTGEISRKIERGKHTTRHAELYPLKEIDENGAKIICQNTYIADSPGFSSLSVDMIPKNELQNCFPEFRPLLGKCYFTNCGHISEPNCAVKEQVGTAIDEIRYQRYLKCFTQKN